MNDSRQPWWTDPAARPEGTAIISPAGPLSYAQLRRGARSAAAALADAGIRPGDRVALLHTADHGFAVNLLGIWQAGAVAVPMAVTHPPAELLHVAADSGAAAIIADEPFTATAGDVAGRTGAMLLEPERVATGPGADALPMDPEAPALIIYTSGSTGRPKGVVWRHRHVAAQIDIMTEAWEWEESDRSLLVLPLHHVHGLVNVLLCTLANGATCEMAGGFDPGRTLDRLGSGDVTVFMAVPTIYRRLITAYEALPRDNTARISAALGRLRLMVSGSAALPVPTLERWRQISGHTLLERYGMTEIGMALTNPYRGERIAGTVGRPFPGVDLRIVDDTGRPVIEGTQGEIELRGPTVFDEYWQRPAETAAAFRDGWFMTGDAAVVQDGRYRILGRMSVDIIKTGGEKVSALEIEDVLRRHDAVRDCAVVGIPDEEWGERVAAAVVPAGDTVPSFDDLRAFARERLAPEKLPRDLLVVDDLPRNAMGKVLKAEVALAVRLRASEPPAAADLSPAGAPPRWLRSSPCRTSPARRESAAACPGRRGPGTSHRPVAT